MRPIMALMIMLALLVPGSSTVASNERTLILALNPQPEPPSMRRGQRTQKLIKSNRQRQRQQLRHQDWRKLNPQPEPPSLRR